METWPRFAGNNHAHDNDTSYWQTCQERQFTGGDAAVQSEGTKLRPRTGVSGVALIVVEFT
jgi:hypothetical protein